MLKGPKSMLGLSKQDVTNTSKIDKERILHTGRNSRNYERSLTSDEKLVYKDLRKITGHKRAKTQLETFTSSGFETLFHRKVNELKGK